MGLFSDITSGSTPEPFTGNRWPRVLTSMDINFSTDSDGDHLAEWDDMRVWFEGCGSRGEIMVIRAIWGLRPPHEAFDAILRHLNDWNANTFWPRAFVHRLEKHLVVIGDHNINMETGIDDEFLCQQVTCMLAATSRLFEQLAEAFPESKRWMNATNR